MLDPLEGCRSPDPSLSFGELEGAEPPEESGLFGGGNPHESARFLMPSPPVYVRHLGGLGEAPTVLFR